MLSRQQSKIDNRIIYAMKHDQLQLYLQPKVNMQTMEIVGAECLIRWHLSSGKVLSPSVFMQHIRDSKLRFNVTEFVIKEAMSIIKTLKAHGLYIPVSVNLDPEEFVHGVNEELQNTVIGSEHANNFEIEITETEELFTNEALMEKINHFRRKGIHVTLDDYGTGYANHGALNKIEFDTIKLDRMFARMDNRMNIAMISHCVHVSSVFSKLLVVEGIETKRDMQRLVKMGVTVGQGFYLGSPVPFLDFLQKYTGFEMYA